MCGSYSHVNKEADGSDIFCLLIPGSFLLCQLLSFLAFLHAFLYFAMHAVQIHLLWIKHLRNCGLTTWCMCIGKCKSKIAVQPRNLHLFAQHAMSRCCEIQLKDSKQHLAVTCFLRQLFRLFYMLCERLFQVQAERSVDILQDRQASQRSQPWQLGTWSTLGLRLVQSSSEFIRRSSVVQALIQACQICQICQICQVRDAAWDVSEVLPLLPLLVVACTGLKELSGLSPCPNGPNGSKCEGNNKLQEA